MRFYSSNISDLCPATLLDSVWQEGIQYNLHTVDEVLANKLSGIAAPQVQEVRIIKGTVLRDRIQKY